MNCDRFLVSPYCVPHQCKRHKRDYDCRFEVKRKAWDLDRYFGDCAQLGYHDRWLRCQGTRHEPCGSG